MISGDKVTDLSLANARELIENRRGKHRTITKENRREAYKPLVDKTGWGFYFLVFFIISLL